MIADVVKYTKEEGGEWLDWQFKTFKPTEPELKTMNIRSWVSIGGSRQVMFRDQVFGISVIVHSLKLSDGREWDCINGFRKANEKV